MKCKICGKEFELKKKNKYLATEKISAFGALKQLPKTFEAFDCPHCGCQNVINIREGAAEKMKINFSTIALPLSIEKIELESGEGMIRIAFLFIHLDIKYHKN